MVLETHQADFWASCLHSIGNTYRNPTTGLMRFEHWVYCRVRKGTGGQVDMILNRADSSFIGVCEAVLEASGNCRRGMQCSYPLCSLGYVSWGFLGADKHGVVLVTIKWTFVAPVWSACRRRGRRRAGPSPSPCAGCSSGPHATRSRRSSSWSPPEVQPTWPSHSPGTSVTRAVWGNSQSDTWKESENSHMNLVVSTGSQKWNVLGEEGIERKS